MVQELDNAVCDTDRTGQELIRMTADSDLPENEQNRDKPNRTKSDRKVQRLRRSAVYRHGSFHSMASCFRCLSADLPLSASFPSNLPIQTTHPRIDGSQRLFLVLSWRSANDSQ